MHSFRISKFSPDQTASERREDWTSISDVGGVFGGTELTHEAYEAIESRYLEAVRLMARAAAVGPMDLSDLVRSSIAPASTEWLREDMTLDIERVLLVLKHQLRGELSCHLEAANGFSIDVGFDLYVYVTTPASSDREIRQIEHMGLSVDREVSSPYFDQ